MESKLSTLVVDVLKMKKFILIFKVDFTDADSPFSNMSGFNIDEIQKDNQLQNGPFDVTKQTTTPPVVDPKVEAINRYKKGILEDKNYVKNFGQVVEHAYSVEHAYGDYDFDQYTSNVSRYRGYGPETFNRLGFNPLSDSNEKYFNENLIDIQNQLDNYVLSKDSYWEQVKNEINNL